MAQILDFPGQKDRLPEKLHQQLTRQLKELEESLEDHEKAAEAKQMIFYILQNETPALLRGGGFQTIPGYFFPLQSFRTSRPQEMEILLKWRIHYEDKGIDTLLSYWGGRHKGLPGGRHYVDLAVNHKQHLEALGNNGNQEE